MSPLKAVQGVGNKPPVDLLRAVLKNTGPYPAYQALRRSGYHVTIDACKNMRATLIAEGVAQPVKSTPPPIGAVYVDPANDARRGSDALLKAIDRLYGHYALTRGCSVPRPSALNYSAAQLRKMAA
ncbi:hypothetical protein AB5I41_31105 [Sphingomonas sp. MMS24-JH45]